MRIVHISTYDIQGGAALAAYRLHRGLRQIGENCRMLVMHKASADDMVSPVFSKEQTEAKDEHFFLSTVIQNHYIDSHRTDISNTIFTLPYPGYDLASLSPVQEADIINLHWVACYQSPVTLQRLFQLSKPVVWTLHDQWAFTGGCHYAAGCEKYRHDCAFCPQLTDDPFNLPAANLKDKLTLFAGANLTIVTPSHWLASCVRESTLFKNHRVEVIPYSLETEVYRPLIKEGARKELGLPTEAFLLLFGATEGAEKRKGYQELLAAVGYALKEPGFKGLVENGRFKIVCFGNQSGEKNSELPIISLGFLDTPEKIRSAYAAADLFILPSQEDNLPNTMLEALSCATPVLAFAVGGIPDIIEDGINGRLIPADDIPQLARAILSFVFNPEQREVMGQNGRRLMEEQFALPVQARRYSLLYQELCSHPQATPWVPVSGDATGKNAIDFAKGFQVNPVTALGPHFDGIYDSLLFRALKEYTPRLQRDWQASEVDRAARMDQIIELTRLLRESEADRVIVNSRLAELNSRLEVRIRRTLSGLCKGRV